MAEVRQMKEKQSKKLIQRGQRSPELGGGVTARTQKDTKDQWGGVNR